MKMGVNLYVRVYVRMYEWSGNLSPPIPPIESIEFSKKHSLLVLFIRGALKRNWKRQQLQLRLIDDVIVSLAVIRCQSENENW